MEKPASWRSGFLAPFLGAFAATLVIAGVAVALHLGLNLYYPPASNGQSKSPLLDVSSWNVGHDTAQLQDGSDQPDIGWWARTFDLPKQEAVSAYLDKQGLNVTHLQPAHYATAADDTVLTYQVEAVVPTQLMRLGRVAWQPAEPEAQRFAHVLVLNDGLSAGEMWDTQHPRVAAEAGSKLNFAWRVRWDKSSSVVETDRLPLSDGVVTPQEAGADETEQDAAISQLNAQIRQIDARMDNDTAARLAQVPPDPPKPELLSRDWGGDGSGEPSRSAERIGGGTAAGAAGGAAIGAAAGDAGLGAGIGAGVGLIGGLIYDGISKHNDRERNERKVTDENEQRLDGWRATLSDLKSQRARIRQESVAEKEQMLADLASRIKSNGGHIDGAFAVAPASPVETPPIEPAPTTQPSANAPPVGPNQSQPAATPTTSAQPSPPPPVVEPAPTADQPSYPRP